MQTCIYKHTTEIINNFPVYVHKSYMNETHTHISPCLCYVVHFASDMKTIKEFEDHLFYNCFKNTKTVLYISPSGINRRKRQ